MPILEEKVVKTKVVVTEEILEALRNGEFEVVAKESLLVSEEFGSFIHRGTHRKNSYTLETARHVITIEDR